MTPDEIDALSQQLIRRWKASAKDTEAFEELHRLHRDYVLGVVARKLKRAKDDDQVEEIAQKCWVELVEGLESYEQVQGVRFRGWLCGRVRSRCSDARRDARAGIGGKTRPLETGLEVARKGESTRVPCADMDGLQKELAQALAALPAEQREILRLKNEEGLSLNDIALRLGLKRTNVQDRFNEAMGKLKPIYQRYCT